MSVKSRPRVVALAACMLLVSFPVAGCGSGEGDELELKAAEKKALQAERALEEIRQERDREAAAAEKRKAEARARKAQKAKRSQEAAATAEVEETPEAAEPPNVVGLPLPAARNALEGAGYEVAPENTDTTFGIVVERNYTVCRQDPARGKVVVVLAQKYGC